MKNKFDFLAIRYQNGKGQNKKIRPFTLLWILIVILGCICWVTFIYMPFIILGIFK